MSALERLKEALAGHYRLERELGAGGMATVYLARMTSGTIAMSQSRCCIPTSGRRSAAIAS